MRTSASCKRRPQNLARPFWRSLFLPANWSRQCAGRLLRRHPTEEAIAALLTQRNIDEAAKSAGIAPNTLLKQMKDPELGARRLTFPTQSATDILRERRCRRLEANCALAGIICFRWLATLPTRQYLSFINLVAAH